MGLWRNLPESDLNRQVLVRIFAHPAFQAADLPAREQQMIFSTFWGAPYGAPPNGGAHAIMAIRRDGGRIFYKNPQYPGSQPAPGIIQGGTAANPPRRYEDPSQSLESISEADLATWIQSYFVPDQIVL